MLSTLDGWDIFILVITAIFGGTLGYLLGVIITDSNRRESLQIVWEKLDKIIEKVKKLEKTPPEQQNQARPRVNPSKITLKSVQDKILDIADRLEEVSKTIKKTQQTGKSPLAAVTTEKSKTDKINLPEKNSVPTKNSSENFDNVPPLKTFPVNNQSEPIDYSFQSKSFSSQITTLYNRGINERSDRDLFWETFSIIRISNANAVAQGLGEVSEPDFREAGNGDFLAIEKDNQSYYVVPLFDTTITPSAYNEGGISYAFDCGIYDLQSARSILRVNKAAIFRRDGGQWFLVDGGKGELVLQN